MPCLLVHDRSLVLAPVVQIPVELEKLFVVLEHPLPDRLQLHAIARELTSDHPDDLPHGNDLQQVLDAAAGLTRYEAEGSFSFAERSTMSTIVVNDIPLSADRPAQRLRRMAAAVRVHLRWWGTHKTLTPQQKEEVGTAYAADVRFLTAGKRIIDVRHAAFRKLTAIRTRKVTSAASTPKRSTSPASVRCTSAAQVTSSRMRRAGGGPISVPSAGQSLDPLIVAPKRLLPNANGYRSTGLAWRPAASVAMNRFVDRRPTTSCR